MSFNKGAKSGGARTKGAGGGEKSGVKRSLSGARESTGSADTKKFGDLTVGGTFSYGGKRVTITALKYLKQNGVRTKTLFVYYNTKDAKESSLITSVK